MKAYKEIIIKTTPFIPEIVSGVLWELNISGITEEEDFIKVFLEKNNSSKEEVKTILDKLKDENLIVDYSVEEFELQNRNWNEDWEKNLSIIKVTDRIVIKPSSKVYNAEENEVVITIDPKMSFGTGEHQTTKLMLRLIERYIQPGMKVLDLGSGTAVLAIAAAKLGAASAVAIDNDELCFQNGNENCKLNKVDEKVTVKIGGIKEIKENNFDLVLVNIQKNILMNIVSEIKSRLTENGLLILSGLLEDDEKDIIERYNKINFTFIEKQKMDEWIAVVFRL